ncbi:MAG: hypothetical protein RMX96_22985 [Nostoc sp. ChiSLP02]|nr:hypothetical protein [Nostoc sp. DedSLP05]MDZ8103256.1 hypothetical protein [Nostoc sp. DedSLP01]MDZ8187703.1 hypothetical protein [Nostoc sp. ChiSLP02]
MKTELEIKQALHEWIVNTNGKIQSDELKDDTPIIERRIISSLQVMELLLFIEQLSDRPINFSNIKHKVFRDINAIHHNFFQEVTNGK